MASETKTQRERVRRPGGARARPAAAGPGARRYYDRHSERRAELAHHRGCSRLLRGAKPEHLRAVLIRLVEHLRNWPCGGDDGEVAAADAAEGVQQASRLLADEIYSNLKNPMHGARTVAGGVPGFRLLALSRTKASVAIYRPSPRAGEWDYGQMPEDTERVQIDVARLTEARMSDADPDYGTTAFVTLWDKDSAKCGQVTPRDMWSKWLSAMTIPPTYPGVREGETWSTIEEIAREVYPSPLEVAARGAAHAEAAARERMRGEASEHGEASGHGEPERRSTTGAVDVKLVIVGGGGVGKSALTIMMVPADGSAARESRAAPGVAATVPIAIESVWRPPAPPPPPARELRDRGAVRAARARQMSRAEIRGVSVRHAKTYPRRDSNHCQRR